MFEAGDRDALEAAVLEPRAAAARVLVCEAVASELQAMGHDLWVTGWASTDAWMSGLGTLAQMAGELAAVP
jgi:hypothetical protein